MANIDRAFIDQVLASTDIVELIKEKVALSKNGANYKGLCPFHNEKTPSFNVSSNKQFYHCFGCGASGDAIKFLTEHDHLTFIEALSKLAQAANIEMPDSTKKNDTTYNLFISNKNAADFYNKTLKSNNDANTYLSKRDINQTMIETFQIGLANDSWDDLTKIFTKEKIIENALEAGLLIKSNNKIYDRFRNRIMFPIRNSTGNIIGFGGRIFNQQDGAKYLNSPETKLFHKSYELYGLYESKKSISQEDKVLIVEGYTDVIGLHNSGIKNCVATLGTAFTKFHFKKIIRYTNNITFCFDGDVAGKSAAWKAINNCLPELKDGVQLSLIFLPEGSDPDTFVKEEKDEFLNLINNAMPLSQFIIHSLKSNLDINSVEGRTTFLINAKKIIDEMPDITYTTILKKEFENIGGNTIRKNIAPKVEAVNKESSIQKDHFDIKELTLINILLEYPTLLEDSTYAKYITNSVLIDIYESALKEKKMNQNFKAAHIINRYTDDHIIHKIMTMESNEKSEDSARLTINEIASQLEKNSNEDIYFDLLNRYSNGDKLSDDERQFIKNFKK
ncbi:MAG: DNA primase [Candidatus Actinomarinaceae bacterium]